MASSFRLFASARFNFLGVVAQFSGTIQSDGFELSAQIAVGSGQPLNLFGLGLLSAEVTFVIGYVNSRATVAIGGSLSFVKNPDNPLVDDAR